MGVHWRFLRIWDNYQNSHVLAHIIILKRVYNNKRTIKQNFFGLLSPEQISALMDFRILLVALYPPPSKNKTVHN